MDRCIGLITANYSVKNPSALTESRPPAALPVAGRYRMVDFALSNMVNAGMRTVGLILPYNYRALMDHVESGKDWSLDRKHGGLFNLPGSAFGSSRSGARFLIRDLIDNRMFLEKETRPYVVLSAANIILNMDYTELIDEHVKSGADITVVTKRASEENVSLTGFHTENGRVTGVHQGVQFGDTAFMDTFIVSIDILKQLLGWYEAVDYLDLFEALIGDLDRVNVRTFTFDGPAMAVFSAKCFYKNSMKLLDPEIDDEIFGDERPIYTKAHDNPPAKYEPGSKVSNALVAGGSRIAGCVENSILGRSVIVEAGATVRNSIIMQSCTVECGARVENAIIDRDNVVPARTELRGTTDDVLIKGKGTL